MQQDALGHARTEALEAARVAQELDDLLQLRTRLLDACDVVPAHPRVTAIRAKGGGLGTRHHRHGPEHEPDQQDQEPEREPDWRERDDGDERIAQRADHGCDDVHAGVIGPPAPRLKG